MFLEQYIIMISEDHVTLKTAVMMLKIHRNKLQFNTYSHRKTAVFNCNNISQLLLYFWLNKPCWAEETSFILFCLSYRNTSTNIRNRSAAWSEENRIELNWTECCSSISASAIKPAHIQPGIILNSPVFLRNAVEHLLPWASEDDRHQPRPADADRRDHHPSLGSARRPQRPGPTRRPRVEHALQEHFGMPEVRFPLNVLKPAQIKLFNPFIKQSCIHVFY